MRPHDNLHRVSGEAAYKKLRRGFHAELVWSVEYALCVQCSPPSIVKPDSNDRFKPAYAWYSFSDTDWSIKYLSCDGRCNSDATSAIRLTLRKYSTFASSLLAEPPQRNVLSGR